MGTGSKRERAGGRGRRRGIPATGQNEKGRNLPGDREKKSSDEIKGKQGFEKKEQKKWSSPIEGLRRKATENKIKKNKTVNRGTPCEGISTTYNISKNTHATTLPRNRRRDT